MKATASRYSTQWRRIINSPKDDIAEAKIAAYRDTNYCIMGGETPLTLRIGRREPALTPLLSRAKRPTAAFITAYNPLDAQVDDATNQAAQLRLSQRLAEVSEAVHPGEGADPSGAWPPEPSLFAIGLPRDQACAIGTEFMQDAIVCVDDGCIPELVLLR